MKDVSKEDKTASAVSGKSSGSYASGKRVLPIVAIAVFLLLAANCSCALLSGGGDEGSVLSSVPVSPLQP